MKNKNLFYVVAATVFCATMPAFANIPATHAGAVTTRSLIAMKHTLMTKTISSYDIPQFYTSPDSRADEYGHLPTYGEMLIYGEVNDDGNYTNALYGHSGGDVSSDIGTLWVGLQRVNDDMHINHYGNADSDYTLAMFGLGRNHTSNPSAQWGIYGGYIGGKQKTPAFKTDTDGAYIGLYDGISFGRLRLSATGVGGFAYNDTDAQITSDRYTTTWAGVMGHAAYTITVDPTFALQPEMYIGYTWISGPDYTLHDVQQISNDGIRSFEFTPGIRAIKGLSDTWFGKLHMHYVMTHTTGGDIKVDNVKQAKFDVDDYFEYGLSIEKIIDRFFVSGNINRMDGGHRGWGFGADVKYLF